MRSRRDDVADGPAVERALTLDVCGLGGRLTVPPESLTAALAAARIEHDDRLARRIARFAAAPDGAFVWTRDAERMLWLGRLDGPWRYDASDAARAVDLVHVRDCIWLPAPVAEHAAPAGVLASFGRGGRNWQRIHADGVDAQTRALWDAEHPRPA